MSETEYKGILHKEVNKLAEINPRLHRVSSMLLDHIIMIMVIAPPMIFLMIVAANGILEISNTTFYVFFFFMMFIYINKDFFNAKSPAKRILGYQVINRKNGQPATELQCLVRNLTIAIAWPLEVIIGLINPERRIGDFLANTKIIASEKEKIKSIWTDLKNTKLNVNFIVILIIGGLYFYGLSLFFPRMN